MDGKAVISLDKLPIKRLEAIEENGAEIFPSDVGYEEKRISLIRRIDFAWAVEKDSNKKQKSSSSKESSAQPWPWQNMIENLHSAHQELSVIIDLINTVEANDAVTVAGMTRPKQLPNEHLSDLAVSAATKLQCFRHLGKYFKQSAKALEQQVAREARFYGALIRLQQNWKVKRQRTVASASGSEGFSIDLFDNSLYDQAAVFRPLSISTLRVDRDSAGMLAICLPPNSCRSLHFGFYGSDSGRNPTESSRIGKESSDECNLNGTSKKEPLTDDEFVKQSHSVLRAVHRAICSELVFDIVSREAFSPSLGVYVTGIRENHLLLSIGQELSVFISLAPSDQDKQTVVSTGTQNSKPADFALGTFDGADLAEGRHDNLKQKPGLPDYICYEIYLQQLFHEHVLVKAKDRPLSSGKTQLSGHPPKEKISLLGHFCLSLAHRIFSSRVLMELDNLVSRVSYLHLLSHPTWHSRTSSWTLFMKVPQSILRAGSKTRAPNGDHKNIKSQFRTKVVVNDDCINVEGEGTPNTVGLFRGNSEDICLLNRYDCDLPDLPVILMRQLASQVIGWLHEEALMMGIKSSRNFLCLSFELDQGETLSLVAHVDPEDPQGCISWWLTVDDGFSEDSKLNANLLDGGSEYRKFLGHLPLDVLYSTLLDLVSLSSGG